MSRCAITLKVLNICTSISAKYRYYNKLLNQLNENWCKALCSRSNHYTLSGDNFAIPIIDITTVVLKIDVLSTYNISCMGNQCYMWYFKILSFVF